MRYLALFFCVFLFSNQANAECKDETTEFLLNHESSDQAAMISAASNLYECLSEVLETQADLAMVELAMQNSAPAGRALQRRSGSYTYSDDDDAYDTALMAAERQKQCNCKCPE
ncbi:MAG: hypothetical protein AAFX02_00890 [Pseudomonadota bacterium]